MSIRSSSWILLTSIHESETMIFAEAPVQRYIIAPSELKKDDIVYLWWNIGKLFFGWGEVIETPKDIIEEVATTKKRKRQAVMVKILSGFNPQITDKMMRADRNLKDLIPAGFDDLYAIKLRPAQAGYLNDFMREHKLNAPLGSTTTSWLAQENAPQITMQAILTLGDKTSEGQLVEGVRISWDALVERFIKNPEELYNFDPRKLEELIAGAYVKAGYEVELTPRSGDRGRDVVATKHGIGSIRIFDQVKRYKISSPVTLEEVASLLGTITAAPNVSKGVITTTSIFAPKIYENDEIMRLVPHRLELRPRNVLLPWLDSLRKY